MEQQIANTIAALGAYAADLSARAEARIKQCAPAPSQSAPAVQPAATAAGAAPAARLLGFAGLAGGVIWVIFKHDSPFPYILAALGLAALGFSASKKPQAPASPAKPKLDTNALAAKLIAVSNSVQKEWAEHIDQFKEQVQKAVKQGCKDEAERDRLMASTYYAEPLSIDTSAMVKAVDSADAGTAQSVVDDFARAVGRDIARAAATQSATWGAMRAGK